MASPPYAHTLFGKLAEEWEPLFTPFGDGADECQRENCQKCQRLEPYHGHLNKVAFWTAKFASEMFAPGSPESKSAHDWGYLAGLWHDLGKFPEKWQTYLRAKSDIHSDEVSGKVDHSTAGAQHAVKASPILGHLLGYMIAGHHSGLLDGVSNNACQASRLLKEDLPDWGYSSGRNHFRSGPSSVRISSAGAVLARFVHPHDFLEPRRCRFPRDRGLHESRAGESSQFSAREFSRRNLPADR